ncbi:2-oxo-4-hydroxy-4-carboxy-5-ureidoimidazoline decarboxylase [Streptomyces sp. NRRL F-5123]|uniref:2-oxo-4-hydroxy-4-carboxy-5-ureidoimidazoline decarboxylase n=1 Tax=Streptomyces sp. NRRL F-5123 TaxID=1463856 RepID=UPI0004E26529|nr:2-oxo-4-hydroxy-4-carboxy-5-ureidoimidazoline decarboxylase [Streptomyces sp. NRRL F-5123]
MTSRTPPGLSRLNQADAATAVSLLREVCASTTWCERMAAGRPYAHTDELLAASDAAMSRLTAADLHEAMAAHPPIGRPAPGDAASAREQSGVAAEERAELLELGEAYRRAHGHVFLICATGASGERIRAELRARTGNDTATEREIVRTELGKINRIRLGRLAGTPQEDAP